MMTTILQILAKAPRPGYVKTRLIPALGADGACRVHRRLLVNHLRVWSETGYPLQLWCAPDCSHDFFQACRKSYRLSLHTQAEGDIGLRMKTALCAGLEQADSVLLSGSDCPLLDTGYIRAARDALKRHEVVFVPVEDGGYALVGMRGPVVPDIFSGIAWSTGTVMQATRRRLHLLGLSFNELGCLWDVDRPEDLPRLQTLWEKA